MLSDDEIRKIHRGEQTDAGQSGVARLAARYYGSLVDEYRVPSDDAVKLTLGWQAICTFYPLVERAVTSRVAERNDDESDGGS